MKLAKRVWLIGLIWACGIPLNVALAQVEPGIYAGFFFGASDSQGSAGDFDASALAVYDAFTITADTRNAPGFDTKDSGYGFAVGYRFNSWLAVEGGYVDLGDAVYRETSSGRFQDENGAPIGAPRDFSVRLTSNIKGFSVSALGILPLSYRWEAYARAGFLIGDDELSIGISDDTAGERASLDVSGSTTETMLGVGISFTLVEIYSLRAEFMRVLDAGKSDISGENDIDLLSIGVTVRF